MQEINTFGHIEKELQKMRLNHSLQLITRGNVRQVSIHDYLSDQFTGWDRLALSVWGPVGAPDVSINRVDLGYRFDPGGTNVEVLECAVEALTRFEQGKFGRYEMPGVRYA